MPTALVTGASRGIGRATALRLAARGWRVFAGVRREEDGAELVAAGSTVSPIRLDITDPLDVASLDDNLPDCLDAVVNNAGVLVHGPIEGVPLDSLRGQFEVNIVGHVAVTQAVLPRLREAQGTVVFMSSLSGRIATPMTGIYNATKFALEGLADSLRMELRPWGIRVVLIEPAQTDTDIWREAESEFEASASMLSPEHLHLYAKHLDGFRKSIPRSQRMATSADRVAVTVERALTAPRPHARYVVGAGPKAQSVTSSVLPTRVRDALLRRITGVPRQP